MTKGNGGSNAVRVLLAASSAVRRAGLEAILKSVPSLKLVGSIPGLRTVRERAADLQPDVVLLDIEADRSGLPPLPILDHGLPIIALIDRPEADWTASALRSGVKAVLPREIGVEELVPAIQAAYAGLVLLDPEVTLTLASGVPRSSRDGPIALGTLTPREIEVLRMLAEGLGNKEMASGLGISNHTVKFHISSILDKLGASSRTEAVTLGIRMGIILL